MGCILLLVLVVEVQVLPVLLLVGIDGHLRYIPISDIAQVVFRIFDIFWCAAFLAELALRIIADGPHFLNSKNPERLDSKLKFR